MKRDFFLLPCFALVFLLLLGACSKKAPVESAKATPAPTPRQIDVCALVTSQEVATTQGAALQEAKPSHREQGGLHYSQCYLTLPTLADSIALLVIQRGTGPNAREPKQMWAESFHPSEEQKEEAEREREEEEKEKQPEKVGGLGDEAYWVGQNFGGTLHVLKGDLSLRISVGGPGDEAEKRRKLIALAEIALKRL